VREVDLKYRIPGVTEDVADFVEFVRDSEVVSEAIEMTVNPPRDQYFATAWIEIRFTTSHTEIIFQKPILKHTNVK
jgi:hypothetical protein